MEYYQDNADKLIGFVCLIQVSTASCDIIVDAISLRE